MSIDQELNEFETSLGVFNSLIQPPAEEQTPEQMRAEANELRKYAEQVLSEAQEEANDLISEAEGLEQSANSQEQFEKRLPNTKKQNLRETPALPPLKNRDGLKMIAGVFAGVACAGFLAYAIPHESAPNSMKPYLEGWKSTVNTVINHVIK